MIRRSIISLLVLATALLVGAVPARATSSVDVVQPDKKYAGMTYGEWSGVWWEWAAGIPASVSPFDGTGTYCGVAQRGPVWFLGAPLSAGSPTHVTPTCAVPAGRAVMVPIINAECSTLDVFPCDTGLRAGARFLIDHVTERDISIDGVAIKLGPDTKPTRGPFRVQSPGKFPINWVPGNSFGIGPGSGVAVADGFYVLVRPPKPGSTHHFVFHATVNFNDVAEDVCGHGATTCVFFIDTDYTVHVSS